MASSWEEGGVRRARWQWRATEESWASRNAPPFDNHCQCPHCDIELEFHVLTARAAGSRRCGIARLVLTTARGSAWTGTSKLKV